MTSISELTPREFEILLQLLSGKTNRAIAMEMYISEKTVEFHLNNIYSKTGLRTRVMVSVWAIQQGVDEETREIPR